MKRDSGFTLIETLIVISIVIIMGFFVYPKQKKLKNKKMRESVYNTVYSIKKNLEIYFFDSDKRFYPKTDDIQELIQFINLEKENKNNFIQNINKAESFYITEGEEYTIQINPRDSRNIFFITTSFTSEVMKTQEPIVQ